MLYFHWDSNKNNKNIEKHGVGFSEAASIFLDPDVTIVSDHKHSLDEVRLVGIGWSQNSRVLFVVITKRRSDHYEEEIYRIISARIAKRAEKRKYAKG
ncbi:MAG: BrnT family toxin [Bdellovibrionota bacterium]